MAACNDLINWQLCIVKLRKHMTYCAIASKVSACHKHIEKLARGDVNEPRFNTGIRILDLAYDVLSEDDFAQIKQV